MCYVCVIINHKHTKRYQKTYKIWMAKKILSALKSSKKTWKKRKKQIRRYQTSYKIFMTKVPFWALKSATTKNLKKREVLGLEHYYVLCVCDYKS